MVFLLIRTKKEAGKGYYWWRGVVGGMWARGAVVPGAAWVGIGGLPI